MPHHTSLSPREVTILLTTQHFFSKPCRVKYMYTKEGEKVRVSRRSGVVIPKPPTLKDRKDFKSRAGYAGLCIDNFLWGWNVQQHSMMVLSCMI